MRVFIYFSIIALTALCASLFIKGCAPYHQINGEIYGTYYNIKIRTNSKNKKIEKQVKQKLELIDNQMSVFNASSEINKLNQTPAQKVFILSDNMSNLLKLSWQIWQQTDGRFDPSLGKLIDLWGFGRGPNHFPSDDKINQTLLLTGFDKFIFSPDFTSVTKQVSETTLNLSAIAKGYAVDEIASLLDKNGYDNYLIEIGGEIKTKGFRSDKNDAWIIGINEPVSGSKKNSLTLSLSNMSVATSGNYRNFFSKDGKTYAHIISHKTGKPVSTDVLSASVFNPSCAKADAFATALITMNAEEAIDFSDKNDLIAIIFDNNQTPRFSQKAKQMFMEP